MPFILCSLWALLLGAALAPLIYWFWRRFWLSRIARHPVDRPTRPGILFLTPTARAALGRCANPSRLRYLDVHCIDRHLDRGHFSPADPRPTRSQVETWPEQARLICAGDWAALAELQAKLGGPDQDSSENDLSAGEGRLPPLWMILLAALLLLAAVASWAAADRFNWCECSQIAIVEKPDGGTEIVDVSTDLLFDFNRAAPMTPVHLDKMKEELKSLFAQFDGIEILVIAAHTDPIGGTEDNRALGSRRANFIRSLVQEIIDDPNRPSSQFKGSTIAVDAAPDGPSRTDFNIWRACFIENYLAAKPDRNFPLVDLGSAKNRDGRVPCSQATAETGSSDGRYPACARLPVPSARRRLAPGYAQAAERLRELTACLAPMRHVLIKFRYERQVAQPASPQSTLRPGSAS